MDKVCNNTREIPVPRSINITEISGFYPLQQSLVIGSYVKVLVCEVLLDKVFNKTREIPVPTSRNINEVSGFYLLQQSLVKRSYVKMLVREVLSDRYRIIQEIFQHQGVEK